MSTDTLKEIRKTIKPLVKMPCPKISFKSVNNTLEVMISELQSLNVSPFNSELPKDFVTCYRALLVHRSVSKYVVPGNKKSLKEIAFNSYKEYEYGLLFKPLCRTYGDPIGEPIAGMFRRVFHDFNMEQILRTCPIRFSPGETFISSSGETSVTAKLACRDHWTVTGSCLDDAVTLIYHCRGLKLAAKAFMPSLDRETRAHLFARFKNRGDKVGFYVFRYLLIKHVLIIVDGARASSVPKSTKTDRFINIEGFFNILVQATIEWYFRRKLRAYGNSLNARGNSNMLNPFKHIRDTQHLHGLLIKHPHMCTIDLKNASDSTLLDRMRLFPRGVSAVIARTRSVEVIFPDGTSVFPKKVSSMGNGYTFGLMSFLIYFSLLSHGISSNVFGDDIIVHSKDVQKTLEILDFLGYIVNYEKTFIDHPLRESCGYFYHDSHGYMRTFDITRCDSVTDAIVLTNKCFLLWQDSSRLYQYDIADIFEKAYKELCGLFQASQKGPVPYGSYLESQNLGLYVYDQHFLSKHKKAVVVRETRNTFARVMNKIGCKLGDEDYIVNVPYFSPSLTKFQTSPKVTQLCKYSGIKRGTVRGQGRWYTEACLVTSTGLIVRLGQLSRISNSEAHNLVDYEPKLPV